MGDGGHAVPEDDLIARAIAGDDDAFVEIVRLVDTRVRGYLRRTGVTRSDIEDLAQELFSTILVAFRGGRYEHRNRYAFLAWLRLVAYRLRSPAPSLLPLDVDVADAARTPEEIAETRELGGHLTEVLEETLLAGAASPRDRSLAILRRTAFVLWHVEGLPQPRILQALHGIGVGLDPPVSVSPSMLNNWLSRGDLLRQVVGHLVSSRPDLLSGLTEDATLEAVVPPDDLALARMLWQKRLPEAEIATQLGMTAHEVTERLERVRTAVSQYLTTRIKAELHAIRHGSSRKGIRGEGRSQGGDP